jgi:hypothetical protein
MFLPLLAILILCTGCIQSGQIQPSQQGEQIIKEIPAIQAGNENITNPAPAATQANITEPEPTLIQPGQYPPSQPQASNITTPPAQKPDPSIEFRDKTLLLLDNMQAAKEGILLSYRAGDYDRVREKAKELTELIRKNSIIREIPIKMDYARMNYYEYIDQVGQFAQSCTDGANRWISSDKASANSLFDAAVMASDRADIADKRIRTFFVEHLPPVQTNQSS